MTSEEEYLESVREDNDKAAETQATKEDKKKSKQIDELDIVPFVASLEQCSSKHLALLSGFLI